VLQIHPSAVVSPFAEIERSIRGTLIDIGENVRIDAFVKIKPVGGEGEVRIGPNCYINSGTVMYTGNGITLAGEVLVGPNCCLVPATHAYRERGRTIREQRFQPSRGGIDVGFDVMINTGCIIVDGVTIPDGVVIGAGSLVLRSDVLEPYGVYAGRPLQKIGERT
jgi:virginiamycin A acetyltransferase